MKVILTELQQKYLKPFFTQASNDADANRPGMIMAQIHADFMDVYFVDHDTAKNIIAAKAGTLKVELDGRNVAPENCNCRVAEPETSDKPVFYAVWSEKGSPANNRHENKISAIAEAQRLAQHLRLSYYVIKTIGIVEPVEIPVNYRELK